MADRPTLTELLTAVREFLDDEVQPAVDGRLRFHARVAANALAIAERELARGAADDEAARARLARLLERDGPLDDLERELAARLRHAELADRRAEVLAHLRATAAAKLAIVHPGYTDPPGDR